MKTKYKLILGFGILLLLFGLVAAGFLYALYDELTRHNFTVRYEGVTTGEFSGRGSFWCASINGSPVHLRITLVGDTDMLGDVYISLPLNTAPGQYSFSASTSRGEDFLIYVGIGDETSYYLFEHQDLVSGHIELDNLPFHTGYEHVRGQFEAELENSNYDYLKISGEFDFPSQNGYTTACD